MLATQSISVFRLIIDKLFVFWPKTVRNEKIRYFELVEILEATTQKKWGEAN
jgi:hypothetical protein